MDWNTANDNTNYAYYTTSLMAPYMANDINVYRCPLDKIPSQNGTRLRSYSMNGQMGMAYFAANRNTGPASYDSGALIYVKNSDLICPDPSSAWVFCGESTWTLLSMYSDGYLQVSSTAAAPGFPDAPTARHEGACGFSFADGHTEIHKWVGTTLTSLSTVAGQVRPAGQWVAATASDPDWIWFAQHTACKSNGQPGP
jgi:prepilin-type processing-associated H-X9-DG protein